MKEERKAVVKPIVRASGAWFLKAVVGHMQDSVVGGRLKDSIYFARAKLLRLLIRHGRMVAILCSSTVSTYECVDLIPQSEAVWIFKSTHPNLIYHFLST